MPTCPSAVSSATHDLQTVMVFAQIHLRLLCSIKKTHTKQSFCNICCTGYQAVADALEASTDSPGSCSLSRRGVIAWLCAEVAHGGGGGGTLRRHIEETHWGRGGGGRGGKGRVLASRQVASDSQLPCTQDNMLHRSFTCCEAPTIGVHIYQRVGQDCSTG